LKITKGNNKMDKIKGKFVQEITVTDPDSNLPVEVTIIKLETGGMIGVDSSFVIEELPIYSPFDEGVEIEYTED